MVMLFGVKQSLCKCNRVAKCKVSQNLGIDPQKARKLSIKPHKAAKLTESLSMLNLYQTSRV